MKVNMNFKILIPARGGSKRIPNKNMIDIAGKPLISYVLDQCKLITDDVYVSSDDSEILDFCVKSGVNTIVRPEELSTDFSRSEEAIEHFIKEVEDDFDIIVVVQPTSPLLLAKYIEEGLGMIDNYDTVMSVVKDTPFYWDEDGNPINFKLGDKWRGRTQDRTIWYKESGAFYITKVKNFMSDHILQNGKVGFVTMNKSESIDIDTYEDLELVDKIIRGGV